MNTRQWKHYTLAERKEAIRQTGEPQSCDCPIPVPNLTPWFGLIPGDCCTCKRPIPRKDNP